MRAFAVVSCCVVALGACASDDDGIDLPPPPTGPWTSIERVTFDPPIAFDTIISPTLSPDRLEMYVDVPNTGIARRTRATTTDPFGPPSFVNELFDPNDPNASPPFGPRLGPDGLRMYLQMSSVTSDSEIWTSTRANLTAPWSMPAPIAALSSPYYEGRASACADDDQLVFESNRVNFESYEYRDGQVRVLDELGMASSVPFVTADCKTLFFGAMENQGLTTAIFVSHRDRADDRWSTPTRVSELVEPGRVRNVLWVSPDQRHMLVEEYTFNNVDRTIQWYAIYEASR